MTGVEAYNALKKATDGLPIGSSAGVHPLDAIDLQKLKVSDLESRDYDRDIAARVSADLLNASLDELGRSMGLKLSKDKEVSRLTEPKM